MASPPLPHRAGKCVVQSCDREIAEYRNGTFGIYGFCEIHLVSWEEKRKRPVDRLESIAKSREEKTAALASELLDGIAQSKANRKDRRLVEVYRRASAWYKHGIIDRSTPAAVRLREALGLAAEVFDALIPDEP